MIFVDSSVWIDHFNGVRSVAVDRLDHLLDTSEVAIGDLILAEVLRGFRSDHDFATARDKLGKLPFEPMVGEAIALASARNYRTLRTKGVTVRKTIDLLIGTFCIERGHSLLHADRDFDTMEAHLGLRVI